MYHFLIQDVLYLKAHAKVYGKALFISETLEDYRVFHSLLGVIEDSNDSIQWSYIHNYNLTDEYISKIPAKSETQESIDFIMNIAYQDDIRKILVAILPCLLSYSHIFQKLNEDPLSQTSLYANSIDNYASQSYKESCDYWIEYTESKCANSTKKEEKELSQIFKKANELELKFWEMLSKS
ncbi:transcriptional regulator [Staphylococcus aureus]|uniref:transcriptional regulator n=1 Tax=Staphylococcus aureus TaxID=1280 RepID=UPI002FCDF2E8